MKNWPVSNKPSTEYLEGNPSDELGRATNLLHYRIVYYSGRREDKFLTSVLAADYGTWLWLGVQPQWLGLCDQPAMVLLDAVV